jgi:hypothetical protein
MRQIFMQAARQNIALSVRSDNDEIQLHRTIVSGRGWLQPRGTVHVKGKGDMEVWHVTGSETQQGSTSHGTNH